MGDYDYNQYVPRDTFEQYVIRGLVPGAEPFIGFGEKDIAAAGLFDAWAGPTAAQPLPPVEGLQLSMVSSDAADGVGGLGIREVAIHYVDANGDEQEEHVLTNGVTPVLTTATDIRFVQCIHTADEMGVPVGASGAAVGTIDFSNGGTVYKRIPAGMNRCLSSARMVPRDHRLLLHAFDVGVFGNATRGIARLMTTTITEHDIFPYFYPRATVIALDAHVEEELHPGLLVPEFGIVKIEVDFSKAGYVVATWSGILERAWS